MTLSKFDDPERRRFESEIVMHLDHLYRIAYFLVKNDDQAQECVQETCARALGAQEKFAPGSNIKAWLTKILYNFFYDSYRRQRRMVAAEDLGEAAEQTQAVGNSWQAHDPGPETRILAQELGAKIAEALKIIPEEFRAPIVLVDMGDFSYAEAAEILSCPIGTVRSRLSRGRKLLQQILSSYARRGREES